MIQPGVLPPVPPIQSLPRISPSRFLALNKCLLREIWTTSRQLALLPSAPVAKLGSIIHKLLEKAGKGELGGSTAQEVETAWLSLVAESEQEMQSSWLEQALVPLKNTVTDYEVRRIRACRKAEEIARTVNSSSSSSPIAEYFELWVQSEDRLIGGSIDHASQTPEGIVLQDYKSGYVMQLDEVTGQLKVKEEYQIQLKLYAVLYASTKKHWPIRLEVIPLQGENIAIPFNSSECIDLLETALSKLKQINSEISQVLSSSKPIELLASPSGDTCRMCQFRPVCPAYYPAASSGDSSYPRDIWGQVIGKQELGNGRINLTLKVEHRSYTQSIIRGLSPCSNRHPALELINEGDQVGVYNLQGNLSTGLFIESPLTTIYLISRKSDVSDLCG